MLTGKAAFDAIAAAAQSFLNTPYTKNGLSYTLTFCQSVTGPFQAGCKVNGFYSIREIVPSGINALVVRYSVAASGNHPTVIPGEDIRVLSSIDLPDAATNADLVSTFKQFLEDAR